MSAGASRRRRSGLAARTGGGKDAGLRPQNAGRVSRRWAATMNEEQSREELGAAGACHRCPAGVRCLGEDTGSGNLLGIQPYMTPADYASEERFHEKLDGYLRRGHEAGFVGEKTVVVFPEYLGAWLVAIGEKESVRSARTVAEAARSS